MTRPQTRLIAYAVFAGVMLYIIATVPRYGIVMASAATLMVVAVSLSKGGRFSESLHALRHRAIEIRVWGQPLPQTGPAPCRIVRVVFYGPSLRLFVTSGDKWATELKIARPRNMSFHERRAEIGDAAYVRWAGQKLAPLTGSPAVTLTLAE
ncbi:MAG TPA: hypothetical protein VFP80_06020 [Thermoanaerobaculia bacterium]|nr:hypothetical protein [Thermoanaerobaculia bacterium]